MNPSAPAQGMQAAGSQAHMSNISNYTWMPEPELLMACKGDPKIDLVAVTSGLIGRKYAEKYKKSRDVA